MIINSTRCDLCGTCIGVCPADALEFTENEICWNEKRCLFCRQCELACPTAAISGDKFALQN
jgi:NAD-dependent dihydropyrimidine dehydrogenase PreA subunit